MPTVANDLCQVPSDAEPADWHKPEPVEPHPSWGPFLPWRASSMFIRLTKGNAQHIGIVLAHKTPRSGKVFVTQKEIHNISGKSRTVVRAAVQELLNGGFLLKAERTMGGFDIVWGKVAYGMQQDKDVAASELTRRENTFPNIIDAR